MVKTLPQLFLIKGKETFLKQQYLNNLISKLSKDKTNWIDVNIYYCDEHDILGIIQDSTLFPSFNRYRVNILKNIDKVPKDYQDKLVDFFEKPVSKSIFILITSEEDSNKNFLKRISKIKKLKEINCKTLKYRELVQWVKNKAKDRNKNISNEAISILLTNSGNNLLNLNNEIEKLCIFCRHISNIGKKEINEAIKKNIKEDVFRLIDNICEKKVTEAINILDNMFIFNESAVKIVGALAWQLKRMIKAKILINKDGYNTYEAIKEAGINFYFKDKFISQINNFSLTDLKEGLKKLVYVDIGIKRSVLSPKLALESFIIDMAK